MLAILLDQLGLAPKGVGLYLDHQKCNWDNYIRVTNAMMQMFKIPRTSIYHRLKYLRLLQDDRLKNMRRPSEFFQ